MATLTRYLIRTFAPTFALAVALMTLILMMGYFVRLFDLAVLKGIPFAWVFQCFALLLPYLLGLAIPMAFLVALLLSLGHLSESGEVLAMRASGFSPGEILRPYLALSLALSALLLWSNHGLSPTGLRRFKDRFSLALAQVSELDPEPKTFVELGDWKLYAETVDRRRRRLAGVRLFGSKGSAVTVNAKGGAYEVRRGEGIVLRLEDGEFSRANPQDPSRATVAQFNRYSVFIPAVPAAARRRNPDPQERTSRELWAMLDGPLLEPDRWEIESELSVRSAIAASPFVFYWIGFPLGLRLEKRGRTWGFAFSLLIIFVYYGLAMLGLGLARKNGLLAPLAPWMADAAGLAAGLGLARWRLRS